MFLDSVKTIVIEKSNIKLPYGTELKTPDGIVAEFKNRKNILIKNIDTSQIKLSAKFISKRRIDSRKQLDRMIASLEKMNIEDILVIKVPFFGVSFDVNDLGLMSGIAFLIILIMFKYSLARELKNLRYVFGIAKDQDSLECFYNLMTMRQVFTVPFIKENKDLNKWEKLPRLLMYLPLIVYLIVFCYDIYSFEYGLSISKWRTVSLYGFNILFLIFMILSTWDCSRLWNRIDDEWEEQATNLNILKEQT